MPIIKAAFKARRQSLKRAETNKKIMSDIDALVRHVRRAITASDGSKAADWFQKATKRIDKAVRHGVLKKNTANRKKSRLARAINKIIKK